jgi:hypothetical protein
VEQINRGCGASLTNLPIYDDDNDAAGPRWADNGLTLTDPAAAVMVKLRETPTLRSLNPRNLLEQQAPGDNPTAWGDRTIT